MQKSKQNEDLHEEAQAREADLKRRLLEAPAPAVGERGRGGRSSVLWQVQEKAAMKEHEGKDRCEPFQPFICKAAACNAAMRFFTAVATCGDGDAAR